MTTIAYIRASTKDQSITKEVQARAIKQFLGRKPDHTFVETLSGAADLEKRVKLLQAITSLKSGDTLVVAKIDRLSRSPMNAA